MDAQTKKVLFVVGGSFIGLWMIGMAWIGTGYLLDLRYKQQVERTQLEQIEAARKEADKQRKEWIAGAKVREEQAKIESERRQAEWEAKQKQRQAEAEAQQRIDELESVARREQWKREGIERERKREEAAAKWQKEQAEMPAKIAAEHKEWLGKMLAEENARKASYRQKAAEEDAAKRAAKQPNN